MRVAASHILVLSLLISTLPGCGSVSIPRVAARGTTILIPVPDAFGSGFGRVLNQRLAASPSASPENIEIEVPSPSDPSSMLEDYQRGELLFALHSGTATTSSLVAYLPIRYITRVHLDEAGSASLPAAGEEYVSPGTSVETGQIVALVDIPWVVQQGTYYIFMQRWKRSTAPGRANFFDKAVPQLVGPPIWPWIAWGGVTTTGSQQPWVPMEIRVVESNLGAPLFNDSPIGLDKLFGYYLGRDVTSDLNHFVPRSKFRIWIQNPDPPPNTPGTPAAWELTIQYPPGKIEILGASLGSVHRSGAYSAVSPATGSPSSCNAMATSKVVVIDPDQKSVWVDLTYKLRNFATCGRAQAGDFTVSGSPKAYDVDGVEILPYAYLDNAYSFP